MSSLYGSKDQRECLSPQVYWTKTGSSTSVFLSSKHPYRTTESRRKKKTLSYSIDPPAVGRTLVLLSSAFGGSLSWE